MPGMVHSVNPKLPVTAGASHLYYIASITGFFIRKLTLLHLFPREASEISDLLTISSSLYRLNRS